jgi:hypothetical protein
VSQKLSLHLKGFLAMEMQINITPEEYLQSLGIDLKTTTLLSVVDGHLRQVDLICIMNEYAATKNKADSK